MKKFYAWAREPVRRLLTGLSVLGLMAASLPASAQTTLPTSAEPAKGSWDHMIPSSFKGSLTSAYEQCMRDAAASQTDPLTPAKCELFKAKLALSECRVVSVPDGIVFDFLNGRWSGKSGFKSSMRKQTGREDRALLCDLEDGVWGYWFTGIRGQSCNNDAFVFVSEPVATPAPSKPVVCRKVYFSQPAESPHYLGGILLTDCCCPPTYVPGLVWGGDNPQSSGFYEVCE